MCERDSSIKAAFSHQRFHASEEHNSCAYTNSISKKKILPVTNLEPRSFQSTLANSESHDASSSLCYNADVVSLNGNSSSSSSMTSSASTNSCTSSAPQSLTSIGVNLRVTGQCSQGGRKYMEDYFSVAYQQSENANDLEYAFVGIYDGHGGAEAATFAKEHLMMEIINQKLFWSDSDQDVLRAIREGYIATHYAMWRDQENWPKTATGLLSTAGTTATVAFIRREKLYIGHVGDSGIVLGYQDDNEDFWRAKPLTTDHKPESLEERARITRSGGKVIVKSGVPRVVWNRPRLAGHKGPIRRNTPVDEIPFLAVARSLGDLWSYNSERNEFVVSPDPDVKVIQINPKTFRCLIFGTDGLWNVVSPQEAVDCVHEKETINQRLQAQRGESPAEGSHGQWTNPSKGLVNKALKTWAAKKMRADNTSVVTVILYPPGATVDANPPGCQGPSYGVEYTRLNAEILTHDDATTYAELATKYTPPEEYRNFKYDDEEPLKINLEPLHAPYAAYSHAYDGFQPVIAAAGHDYYDAIGTREMNGKKTSAAEAEDYNEIDDDDEVCEEESDDNDDGQEETLSAMNTYASDDLPHCSQRRLACSREALQSKLMEQESLDYMNSFAESYTDSLLGRHSEENIANARSGADKSDGDCSDSTSSSSGSSSASGFHSAVYQHNQELQHELLMEHELYQAQCMSQEEGYSLTKLETRGEQQMRYETSVSAGGSNSRGLASKEVQTFQIFQQQNEPLSHTYSESSTSIRSSPSYNINSDASRRENLWEPRYQPLCRFINPYETPKLELNSLLQQEIEEEQQVAMERLEMQRRRVEQSVQQNTLKDPEGCISAEFLEEELVADVDASIQINEISSSMESPMESEEMEVDALVEQDEMEDYAHQLPQQQPHSTKKNIVLIEKIEILQHKPELVIECAPSKSVTSTSLHQASSHAKLLRSKPSYVSANGSKTPSKALINPSPSKRPHFPNVPNENQRFSLRHCNSSAYATLQQQRTDNRQLRSMAPSNVVDYSKRTLRSRNSLSKDMKAKTTLNLRRSTSMSNQYLRTTAASLLGASATQQQQQMSTQRRQRENARPQASVPHLTVALRNTKSAAATSAASNATLYGINLRSRQIVAPVAATQRTNNSSSMHHLHLQQSCEKRNLRSLSAKEAMATTATGRRSCKESNISGNFSKATRLQSTAANLAGPPPSPKLICVAKRARSLLRPKMVPDDFSKRSTLRSAAELTAATAAVRSALQTRSRVQKHMTR